MDKSNLHKLKTNWILLFGIPLMVIDLFLGDPSFSWAIWLDNVGLLILIVTALLHKFTDRLSQKVYFQLLYTGILFVFAYVIFYTYYFPGSTLYIGSFFITALGLLASEEPNITKKKLLLRGIFGSAIMIYNGYYQSQFEQLYGELPNRTFVNASITLFFVGSISFLKSISEFSIQSLEEQQSSQNRRLNFQNDLFSIIAHNIRTPISNLIGQIQIAELKSESNLEIKRIKPSIDLLLGTITSLLNHNKIQKSQESIALKEGLKEVVSRFPGVQIRFDSDNKEQQVNYGLILAIENFVSNAVRFDPHPRITVNHSPFVLTIEDQGPGMTAEVLENYGNPVVSQQGGLGLGVHLSLAILEHLGLKCRIATYPKNGTCIQIYEANQDLPWNLSDPKKLRKHLI